MLKGYKWMVGLAVGQTEISGRPYSKSTCGANKGTATQPGTVVFKGSAKVVK